MEKTIYDLELHESIYINGEDCYVTRVASGWIYKYFIENMNDNGHYYDTLSKIIFVPFDNKFQEVPKQALRKTDVICCGVLERMNLGWMKLEDGTRCMPYIKGHSDENMYRVNNCPSCGKYVRDVMVEP